MKREGKSKKDFSPKNTTKSSFRTKQNARKGIEMEVTYKLTNKMT